MHPIAVIAPVRASWAIPAKPSRARNSKLQIEYLKNTPQVRDVLLSGGDPLVLAPKILEEILTRLREIPHIEIIRIGSRVPVFMPMRVTQELCDMLARIPSTVDQHPRQPPQRDQSGTGRGL